MDGKEHSRKCPCAYALARVAPTPAHVARQQARVSTDSESIRPKQSTRCCLFFRAPVITPRLAFVPRCRVPLPRLAFVPRCRAPLSLLAHAHRGDPLVIRRLLAVRKRPSVAGRRDTVGCTARCIPGKPPVGRQAYAPDVRASAPLGSGQRLFARRAEPLGVGDVSRCRCSHTTHFRRMFFFQSPVAGRAG